MKDFRHGYALVVGISAYRHLLPLSEAVLRDAADLTSILRDPDRCGYPAAQVRHLRGTQAAASDICRELRWLAEVTGPEDTALFFFSGHGCQFQDPRSGELSSALVAVDGRFDDQPDGLVGGEELTELLRAIPAGRLLVLFDSCYAAGTSEVKDALDGFPGIKKGLSEDFYEQLGRGKGRVLMASSRENEPSWFAKDGRHSRFTHYLLEGLNGEAANQTGTVGVLDLFGFLSQRVLADDPERPQHPVMKAEVEDNFSIALAPKGWQQRAKSSDGATGPAAKEASRLPSASFSSYRNNKFGDVTGQGSKVNQQMFEHVHGDVNFNS